MIAILLAAGALVTPQSTCGSPPADAPLARQMRTMRCLVAYVQPGTAGSSLSRSARLKARDVARCGFSHFACGRLFDYWIPSWWPWRGENLAFGDRELGSARAVFRAWLRSPGHRENLLEPWQRFGLAVRRDGERLFWVAHFGGVR